MKKIPADRFPEPSSLFRGFSIVELLLALAIGAAVIIVGVMIFQGAGAGSRPSGTYVTVSLSAAVMENFYGINAPDVDVWVAPNYGCRAKADILRDRFWEDISKASAVFCLGREAGVLNSTHPSTISLPAGFRGQTVDLPSAFQSQLEASIPTAAGTFTGYRGACTAQNLSIYILQPSASLDELSVMAVYDVDFISVTSPAGTYVSGRRYVGDVLTDYYDVFYPAGDAAIAFSPVVVSFERSVRLSKPEGDSIDRLKVAAARPFYFVWWPDPAEPALEAISGSAFSANDPRAAYADMGGRTSFFFVVPMFPAL